MPYSSFTLDEVEQRFDLKLKTGRFLPVLEPIAPSDLLQQFLATTLPLAQETEYSLQPLERLLSVLSWMTLGDSS
jgi:hypothetical protein